MRRLHAGPAASFVLAVILALGMEILPVWAAPVEKDIAAGDEDSYMYGAGPDEIMIYEATATGDVNGDGVDDLVIGHDMGGDSMPFLYTGKVYVYYGRTDIDGDVDLGSEADVTVNGWYVSLSGNDVDCGDVNGDGIDDIIIGCYNDSQGTSYYAGGAAVILGGSSLPATWDFNATLPDLYISSSNAGEICGMSVASGDIDGDGYDDVLFGAPLGNGGVHRGDGTGWSTQGGANADSLRDVSIYGTAPNLRGWAVGEYISVRTTLYYYTGTKWEAKDTGFVNKDVDFNGVSAVDASHVWAVGEAGTIIFWNGGSWSQQTSNTTVELRGVAAVSATDAWAVGDGGVILNTTDGGVSWNTQTSGVASGLRSVSVAWNVDHYEGWAVGDGGVILNTTDGGVNWNTQISGVASDLRSVSAASSTSAWAVGDGGVILNTTDGGVNWNTQISGISETLRGVSAANASSVWAVGDSGNILETSNGGTAWNKDSVLFSQQQNAVDAADTGNIWTVGEYATGRAYICWGRSDAAWSALTWDHNNPILPNKVINGKNPADYCGFPVTTGNLNGDTRDDMVIGAYEADGPGGAREGCGEVYAVYGRNKGAFPYFVNLVSDSNCTVYGGTLMDGLPTSLCRPLKDVNGDRYDDLVMGTTFGDGPDDTRPGCGEVDVIFGGNLPYTVDLASSPPDIMLYGGSSGLGLGMSVAALDFNADGMRELAAGAPGASKDVDRSHCGAVWMANGRDSWPATLDMGTSADMVIYGAEENDAVGYRLSSGNIDGDAGGYEDLVVSDPNGDGPGNTRPSCGEHFVFLGYDNVPPTCEITNVVDGAVLSGAVNVQVDASDYHGVTEVEFRVDGELQHADTATPYEWSWDTRAWEDGTDHTLQAQARDAAGNQADDSRQVKINNAIPPLSTHWYLAEGTTAWGFEEFVLVQNPNAEAAEVTFTFMKPGGVTDTFAYDVAGNSRFTVNVNALVPESDVSTRVVGTRPIICERAMYWNERAGGHDSIGVTNPSPVWYLAEGTTAWGFEEYVLVQNPNPEPVDVTMTFMQPGGLTQDYDFTMAGNARFTVDVNSKVPESDLSTRVEASAPVICERAMYRYDRALGHDTIGTPSVSSDWYLAEGTTAWGFDTYVLVQNPNLERTLIEVEFMKPDGTIVPYGALVPGQSRFTIHVDELPGCEDTDLSTHVSSELPVICERAMYWQGAASPGGHDTIGTPLPSSNWYLAEGTTAWGFEEYVLVQNPDTTKAVVSFTFMKPDGSTVFYSLEVPPESRYSLRVNDLVPESDVSTSVVSDRPVICERAMYWQGRDGGHVTIGVRGN